jgi:hypothetical protein
VPADRARARAYLKRAADGGSEEAIRRLSMPES